MESGLEYSYMYMSENPPEVEQAHVLAERNKARALNFCPPAKPIVKAMKRLVQNWNECCNAQGSARLL